MSLSVTMGRIVWRGTQAGLALTLAVLGLTWLNRVAASVLSVGGSCGSGGAYEIATPCPSGAWMAPVGLLVGLVGLGLYLLRRPAGSPQLLILAWPALFGSLGVQFLRAASAESGAYGFWLCGIVFLVMAAASLVLVMGERGALVRLLMGDGRAEPEGIEDQPQLRIARFEADGTASRFSDLGPVDLDGSGLAPDAVHGEDAGDLSESLDRLSRLHRQGDLSDAEFAEAKQKVLDGA
jgi:hypothetical protein